MRRCTCLKECGFLFMNYCMLWWPKVVVVVVVDVCKDCFFFLAENWFWRPQNDIRLMSQFIHYDCKWTNAYPMGRMHEYCSEQNFLSPITEENPGGKYNTNTNKTSVYAQFRRAHNIIWQKPVISNWWLLKGFPKYNIILPEDITWELYFLPF